MTAVLEENPVEQAEEELKSVVGTVRRAIHEIIHGANTGYASQKADYSNSLARLRGEYVQNARDRNLRQVDGYDQIRHGQYVTIYADVIKTRCINSIEHLRKGTGSYPDTAKDRVTNVITSLIHLVQMIEDAQQSVKDARESVEEEKRRRFPTNDERGEEIQTEAKIMTWVFDIADNTPGVEVSTKRWDILDRRYAIRVLEKIVFSEHYRGTPTGDLIEEARINWRIDQRKTWLALYQAIQTLKGCS